MLRWPRKGRTFPGSRSRWISAGRELVPDRSAARLRRALVGRPGFRIRIGDDRAAEVSAVLHSWEDRFGAILVGLGFATMTVVVTRPPTTDDDAVRVAAEVAALCRDSLWQPEALWPHEERDTTLVALSRQPPASTSGASGSTDAPDA